MGILRLFLAFSLIYMFIFSSGCNKANDKKAEKYKILYYKEWDFRNSSPKKDSQISPSYAERSFFKYYKVFYSSDTNQIKKVKVIENKKLVEVWDFKNGKLYKKNVYYPNGKLRYTVEYSYSPNEIREITKTPKGEIMKTQVFSLDNKGNISKITLYDKDGNIKFIAYLKNNRVFKRDIYNKGKLKYHISYIYNRYGQLIEEDAYTEPDKFIYKKYYSPSGYLIKQERFYEGKPIEEGKGIKFENYY